MSNIKFRIAAKTDVGLVRTNNEDNFQASSDLSCGQMRWVNNEICSLGDKGALIVVADGMGGMNAGEVASELAIETIRDYFRPEKLSADVIKSRFSIEKYMADAIVAADARIKTEARSRPETKGMGTTIVIGWILDGKLYVSWCGDSRAYVYNPVVGLHQISKDHSYVQNLVDKGSITREEAFDFPDSNIITRCLSDGTTKAKPESLFRPYVVCDNDIIMLCTDGLSGMIRDQEIESIMQSNENNMDTLADSLISAACDAEGSDNITICLCQILQGGAASDPAVFAEYEKRLNGTKENFIDTIVTRSGEITPKNKYFWYIGVICVLIALISVATWWFVLRDKPSEKNTENIQTEGVQPVNSDSEYTHPDNTVPDRAEQNVEVGEQGRQSEYSGDNSNGTIFKKNTPEETADEPEVIDGEDADLTLVPNEEPQNVPELTPLTPIEQPE